MLKITQLEDMIQEVEGNLDVPEIRVWCHPHKGGKSGDDNYEVFDSFKEAHEFIESNGEAEEAPLIAFLGHEINIYPETKTEHKTPDHVHPPA